MIAWRAFLTSCVAIGAISLAFSSEELEKGKLTPSARCGECHAEIYAMWKRSMHSSALTDPIFMVSYMQAYLETSGEAKRVCLRCHAPMASARGDLDLKDPISREGIGCDYCHSIVSIDLASADNPFRLQMDGVKRGPLHDAESPVHAVARSPLHQSAEFCAGCHEYVNPGGLPIFTTYTEWKASPQAAAGKTCQSCHMPMTPGETVLPGVGTVKRGSINLHDISGMHSTEQVRRAATAELLWFRTTKPGVVEAEVEVANVGSGHSIPTGLPTRKLILELTLFSGKKEVARFERVYQKILLDKDGSRISQDHTTILGAHSLLEDTRLRPGERRREKFVASVPKGASLRAEMRLYYYYRPEIISRETIAIDISKQESP